MDDFNNLENFGVVFLFRAFANFAFYLLILTSCPILCLTLTVRTALVFLCILRYFASTNVLKTGWSHASCIMYRIIVTRHKILEYINISVCILVREILVHFIAYRAMCKFNYRAFHIGVSTDIKLDAFPL